MRKRIWRWLLPLVAVLAVCGIILSMNLTRRSELKQVQTALQEKLEQYAGGYNCRRIIVSQTNEAELQALAALIGERTQYRMAEAGGAGVLYLPEDTDIETLAKDDRLRESMSRWSPDYYGRPAAVESAKGPAVGSALDVLHGTQAVDMVTGDGITVAIIDTGIDLSTGLFDNRIDERSYNVTQDKMVKDYGAEVLRDESEDGHGTAIAALIGAKATPELDYTGLAPGANLLIIRCEQDEMGYFSTSDLLLGLAHAIACDANVVNMSFEIYHENPFLPLTKLAVDGDMVCVASAGNKSSSTPAYPAADKNVIGVGAAVAKDVVGASFGFGDEQGLTGTSLYQSSRDDYILMAQSNFGENVDLVAPGDLATVGIGGERGSTAGTSQSAALVSGSVALYLSNGNHKYDEFKDIRENLLASSQDMGDPGQDWYCGWGLLDLDAFVVEEKGTVTFDYLTDEIANTQQVFVKNHTLQSVPEPEREFVVFDDWYYDPVCSDVYQNTEDVLVDNITVYAKWENEDDTVPFRYRVLDDGTAEITAYVGKRRSITVPESIDGYTVTSIGASAFEGNKRITYVTLPQTLTNIGTRAFYQMTALRMIEIPAGVRYIRERAFQHCSQLSVVAIHGDGELREIRELAFANCGRLVRFDLPAQLEEITGTAFLADTAMRTVTVDSANQTFFVEDGALMKSGDAKTLVYYPAGRSEPWAVPAGTVSIGEDAFAYSPLRSLMLPEGLTSIGESAFQYSALPELILPESLSSLGDYAFAVSALQSIALPDAVTSVPTNCFYGAQQLEQVSFGADTESVGPFAFSNCPNLRSLVIPASAPMTRVGDGAFSGCSSLREFTPLADRTTIIGYCAFSSSGLTSAVLGPQITSMDRAPFSWCGELTQLSISPQIGVTRLPEQFAYRTGLTSVEIPACITRLDFQCFAESQLEQVSLPASVSFVGNGAFSFCGNLTQITVEGTDETAPYYAADNVLYGRKDDGIQLHTFPGGRAGAFAIPDAVTEINSYAFAGSSLTEVSFGASLKQIGAYAFQRSAVESVCFNSAMREIGSSAFQNADCLRQVALNEGLETLGSLCFAYCSALTQISIPASVKSIGYYSFLSDSALTAASFAANAQVASLGYGAFAYTGLQSFDIPASVNFVENDVFCGCNELSTVRFLAGSRLENLTAGFFRGCSSLRTITFEENNSLRQLNARALEYLENLESINLQDCPHLTNIDNYAMQYCPKLQNLQLPDGLTNIGRYAFFKCEKLSELTLPAEVEHIGRYAFSYCDNIRLYFKSADLPAFLDENWDSGIRSYCCGTAELVNSQDGLWKYAIMLDGTISLSEYYGNAETLDLSAVDGRAVTSLGGGLFQDNTTLRSVVIPEGLKTIFNSAFEGTTALESVAIPASVTHIGAHAFAGSGIRSVSFAENAQLGVISKYAFANTASLTEAAIPASVSEIQAYAFDHSALSSLSFTGNSVLKLIGRNAFDSTALTAAALPDTLEKIDYYAFNGTSALRSVSFGTGADLMIYGYAFYNSGLESVTIPANVTYLGEYVFAFCRSMQSITVDEANAAYSSENGVLFDKAGSKLIACPAGKTGSYTVPAQVSVLGFGAFEGCSLSSVSISEDSQLASIGYRAFYNLENLTSIRLPASLLSIDYYAFAYCSNLQTVTLAEGCQLGGIYEGAFYNCEKLQSFTIPGNVREIAEQAFYGCEAFGPLTFEEGSLLTDICEEAFAYSGVTSAELPEGLLIIGTRAFAESSITSVSLPESLTVIEDRAFVNANLTELALPASLTELGTAVFSGCPVEHLTLPAVELSRDENEYETALSLRPMQLFDCAPSSLKSVHIINGTTIPADAFASCTALETVSFGQKPISIDSCAFLNCSSLKQVDWLDEVVSVGKKAFQNCSSATIQALPNLETADVSAFQDASFAGNLDLPSIRELRTEAFRHATGLADVVLGDNLSVLEESTFYDSSLTGVVVPGIDVIPAWFARGCTRLTSVTILEGARVIGAEAFYGRTLVSLELPSTIEEIGRRAFVELADPDFVLPAGIKTVGEEAFYDYSADKLVLPDGIETIGNRAFFKCSYLSTWDTALYVVVPDSVVNLGANAFGYADTVIFLADSLPANCDEYYQGNTYQVIVGAELRTNEMGLFADAPDGTHLIRYSGEEETVDLTGIQFVEAHAFNRISSLVSVTGTESLERIGRYAFVRCENLSNFDFSGAQNLTALESYAFLGCYHMVVDVDLTGMSQLSLISNSVFNGTGITSIRFSDHYTGPWSIAMLANTDKLKTVVLPENAQGPLEAEFLAGSAVESITIPAGITELQESCFAESRLTEISFAEGSQLTIIGPKVFYSGWRIPRLILPPGVTTIGKQALTAGQVIYFPASVSSLGYNFAQTDALLFFEAETLSAEMLARLAGYQYYLGVSPDLSLDQATGLMYFVDNAAGTAHITGWFGTAEQLTIDTVGDGIPVSVIEKNAFQNNTNLKQLVIQASVTALQENAFQGCTALETVRFEQDCFLEYVGKQAFQNCTALTEVSFAENCGLGEAGAGMFQNDTALTTVTLPPVSAIFTDMFKNCSALRELGFVQAPPLVAIQDGAFSGCSALENIPALLDIPTLTTIGTQAFAMCSSLTELEIPGHVTELRDGVFSACQNLRSITFGEGITVIPATCMSNDSALQQVVFLGPVSNIERQAFFGCSSLAQIELPETLTHLGSSAFWNAPLLYFADNNLQYADGWLVGVYGNVTELNIPAGTVGIADILDPYSYRPITAITLPEGLRVIGVNAFVRCNQISEIEIPDSVTHIHAAAFKECTGLTAVTLPDGLVVLGTDAFTGTSIRELYVPEGVDHVGELSGMRYLEKLEVHNYSSIPSSLRELVIHGDFDSFEAPLGNGSALEYVEFTGHAQSMVNGLFRNASGLKTLILPEGLTSFYAELSNGALENLVLPSTLEEISGNFSANPLHTISFPDGMKRINAYFYDCSDLGDIEFPEGLEEIGNRAFACCRGQAVLRIPSTVTTIRNDAFAGWNVTELYTPACINLYVSYYIPYDSSALPVDSLKKIVVLGSPTELKDNFCGGAPLLEEVVLPDSITSIGSGAFSGCAKLKRVNIPSGVTKIGSSAFSGCIEASVSIPEGVKEIGSYAFYHGPKRLVIPSTVESIGEYAFCMGDGTEFCYVRCPLSVLAQSYNTLAMQGGTLILDEASASYGSNRMPAAENLMLTESVSNVPLNFIPQGVVVYCMEEENNVPWPEGWNSGNTVYYNGNWRYAIFRVDNAPVKGHLSRLGGTIQLPAASQVRKPDTPEKTFTFLGWDADADGEMDNLIISAPMKVFFADAIYSEKPLSEAATVEDPVLTQEEGVSVLDASGVEAEKLTVSIAADAVGANETRIQSEIGTVSFDSAAGQCIADADGAALWIETVDPDLMSMAAPGDQVYALSLQNGGDVSFAEGSATVTVPCTVVPAEGETIKVYYIAVNGVESEVEAVFDPATHTISFTTNHFSIYRVAASEVTDVHEHELVLRSAVAATCTEPGYSGDSYCTICRKLIETGAETPALGHNWIGGEVFSEPGCTTTGFGSFTCDRCGTAEDREIPAMGHDLIHHDAKAPTCTEFGWDAYDSCVRCDYTGYQELPALGHEYVDGTCIRCGQIDPEAIVGSFTDIPMTAYYREAVIWAVENNITAGTSEQSFSPNQACTRAQIVMFLWRAANSPAPASEACPFLDVPEEAYYRTAVLWAYHAGITTGTSDHAFSPNQVCTRAQAVTLLWRSVGSPTVSGDASIGFTDVSESVWYHDAVLWAASNNVTSGTSPNSFSPNMTCSRAQIITFLYKTYGAGN